MRARTCIGSCFAVAVIVLLPAGTANAYSANDIIATYAGGSPAGYVGDGGPAVNAALQSAEFIATDAAGSLYISDSGSHTIRRVNSLGVITTIVGTGSPGYNGDGIPALTAQLNYPAGIAFDGNGDLYVADAGNNRVRKITMSNGLISTVAGTGTGGCLDSAANSAKFSAPVGLAFDSTGALYISEAGNRIVRKLSVGIVTSFAGSCGTPVFDSPYGLMTDASDNVYVADGGPHPYVWKHDSGGNRSVFAGNSANGNTGDGSAANSADVTLTDPEGLARDAAGDIFISSGSVVRVVTPDGIIHTAVGNGTFGFGGDGGIAIAAMLSNVHGLATNAAGHLFVSDLSASPRIRIAGPAAPLVVTVAGDGIPASGDGVASADQRINCPGTCGANYVSGMPVILNATQSSPDPLYEWTGVGCRRGNTACTLVPESVLPTSVTAHFTPRYIKTLIGGTVGPVLHGPFALTFDASANLYFTETADCVVRKLTTTGMLTTIAGNGVCGNLGDGIPATAAELNNPQGVAVDAAGNIYIQDTGNGIIRKVTIDGILHNFATGVFTGSDSPALTIDSSGDLFMLGSSTTIVRVTSDGLSHLFATVTSNYANVLDGLANFTSAGLVAYGSYRDPGASNYNDQSYVHISPQGLIDSGFYNYPTNIIPAGTFSDQRADLFSESDSCDLNAVGVTGQTIVSYSVTAPSCGYAGDGGPAASATLNGAVGLALDSNGNLYVADYGNNAIRVLYSDAIFTSTMDQ